MRSVASVLVVALMSCQGSSRTPPADSAARQAAAAPPLIDSATAVRRAASALGWQETDAMLVKGYRVDSAGALVRLIRLCAPDSDCYGAGGTVRVRVDGTTEVDATAGP